MAVKGLVGRMRSSARKWRLRLSMAVLVVPVVGAVVFAMAGPAGAEPVNSQPQAAYQGHVTSNPYDAEAGSGTAPPDAGATVDPLKYDCTYPSGPSNCQNVGLTHGYYDGSTTAFLYTANFYCDPGVSSQAVTGCEAGAKYTQLPPHAASQDPVYIVVPLGFTPTGTSPQCATPGNCIDHPGSMDLTRLAPALDPILHTTPAQLANAPLSPHSHFIDDRNTNLPEWWNVVVVGATSQTAYDNAVAGKSYASLKAQEGKNGLTAEIPTNVFLYFQTLGGTDGDALNAYHGAAGPSTSPTQSGAAIDPLADDCISQAACSAAGIGLTHGNLGPSTVGFLYTENYFCDRSVPAKSSSGCEAGAAYGKLPPGTSSDDQMDPLYIVNPLFMPGPSGLQCPTKGYCIDHPPTTDLSRLASKLDPILGTTAAQLENAPLSPHSHIVLSANNAQPEWWNVHVIGVTNLAAYNKIMNSADKLTEAQSLAQDTSSGVTMPIPTNLFLWFQVLPGALPAGGAGTGGGSTAGPQHEGLLVGGGGAVLAGLTLFAVLETRRRRVGRVF